VRAILGSFFGTQLSVATLEISFGERLWGAICGFAATLTNNFWRMTALGSSFRKQLWEAIFGNNFREEF
jgi:hypothetical protein